MIRRDRAIPDLDRVFVEAQGADTVRIAQLQVLMVGKNKVTGHCSRSAVSIKKLG
jgi:hypothetical protein